MALKKFNPILSSRDPLEIRTRIAAVQNANHYIIELIISETLLYLIKASLFIVHVIAFSRQGHVA